MKKLLNIKRIAKEKSLFANSPNAIATLADMQDTLETQMCQNIMDCEHFERWIASVTDPVMQDYLFRRFVKGESYVKIGLDLRRKSDTVRVAVRRFLKKEQQHEN